MTEHPKRITGVGLGLRHEIAKQMLTERPSLIEWVEVHPENYILRGGTFERTLADAAWQWPIVPHGLSLAFGSIEPFERDYVAKLRAFLESIGAPWYSDHLCFAGIDGAMLHDLLPLPFTRESVELASARIRELEDGIGIPVAVENVSYYAHPGTPEMTEIDFLNEVLDRSGCKLMLDVNNVYVNAKNHGFDPRAFIDRLPADRVVQIHVAGHLARTGMPIIDTHGEAVCEDVYQLLEHTLRRVGRVPVLLERDQNFPPFSELIVELERLAAIHARVTAEAAE